MAEYFRIDPTIVRIIWVVAAFLSLGIVVLLYVILIFVIPSEDDVPPHSVRSA
jgi:phage shock protein PspC (stress-responsive transcriptional regulator)